MIKVFPTFLAFLTILLMFIDRNNEVAKFATVCFCLITAAAYCLEYRLTLSKQAVFCSIIWVFNSIIQGFVLYMMLKS